MINITIFSKDRACQLELLLRSMKVMFAEFDRFFINILYTYSADEFQRGYAKLIESYSHVTDSNVNFILQQGAFKDQLLSLITPVNQFTVFFVDDDYFKEKFSLDNNTSFFAFSISDEIVCYSLRVHPKLSFCYPMNAPMPAPEFIKIDGSYRWNWTVCDQALDFGYPMSLDGHIFKTDDILPLLRSLEYDCPNRLESVLSFNPIKKPYMICDEKSAIMNIPANIVQTGRNLHGKISAHFLNFEYLEGKVINYEKLKFFNNRSAHQEMDVELIMK